MTVWTKQNKKHGKDESHLLLLLLLRFLRTQRKQPLVSALKRPVTSTETRCYYHYCCISHTTEQDYIPVHMSCFSPSEEHVLAEVFYRGN